MFVRISNLTIRWPRAVLALGIIVIALCAMYASGINSSLSSANGFVVRGSESDRVATQLAHDFNDSPASGIVVFTGSGAGVAKTPAFRTEVSRLLEPLVATGAEITADTGTPATASLISTDGTSSYAVIRLSGSDTAQYQQLVTWRDKAKSDLVSITLGGPVVAQQQSQARVETDLRRAELISFPILALLLLVIFRGVVAALLPLMLGVVAIIGGLALTRFIATQTSVDQYAVNIITILGLGLSIDYSLLMVSRFREELTHIALGSEVTSAVRQTVLTAGRTIFFSGLTVIVSLLTLLVFPIDFLHSIAVGAAAAIAMAMLAALTVLPAMLHLLGGRVNKWQLFRERVRPSGYVNLWGRLGALTMSHPWSAIIGSVAVISALAYPLTQTHFVTQTYRFLPTGTSSRTVAEALGRDFTNQGSRIDVVVHLGGPATSSDASTQLAAIAGQISHVSGVQSVSDPRLAGETAAFTVYTVSDDAVARDVVSDLRQLHAVSATLEVGGSAAALNDLLTALYHQAWLAALIIVVAMFILLGLLLRSAIIPLQAIVINSFAILAAMGVLVLIFQKGHIGPMHWLSPTAGLDPTIPVLIMSIAFGLSMDYGAFLYSRIREEHDLTTDTKQAIIVSLERTGGIITAAGVLLVVVVGSFASSGSAYIEQVGLGLSVAILVDAFIVRLFLAPAVMLQFGRYNWIAPKWMRNSSLKH
ncbi:MMPL family transporter [Candidatus Saccharibacteria bacterium]|nr:MMPL family transporter [Candidatus Saccharibacteria bacterium]